MTAHRYHETVSETLFAPPRQVSGLDDCLFYHTVDLPGYGTIPGRWDLRGKESEYLGGIELEGKRVLEVGPASGHLSFFMERQGAEVVSVEVTDNHPWEFFWDLDDQLPGELPEQVSATRNWVNQIKNSYWLSHAALGSKAKVYYGSGYDIPPELGHFDISLMACMLLHNKNPVRIIENCARLTRESVVIAEIYRPQATGLEFLPRPERQTWDTWWGFSPRFFANVLATMGFTHSRVTLHTQQHFGKPDELFTVIASREKPSDPPSVRQPIQLAINSPVERLKITAGKKIKLPINVANLGQTPVSSSSTAGILISYHWKRAAGPIVIWDGIRTPFPGILPPKETCQMSIAVSAPEEPGDYLLELGVVEEEVAWHDENLVGGQPRIPTTVIAP